MHPEPIGEAVVHKGPRSTLVESARHPRAGLGVGRLWLVVIGEGLDGTYPLPDRGRLAIGRSEDADVRIDHPSVSRSHAVLDLDDQLMITDLGSANGTRVRDRALTPHAPTDLAVGEPVDLGKVMLLVQQRALPAPHRQIWAHGSFEARVEEERARAGRRVVLDLACSRGGAHVEAALARGLRPMDVLGYVAPSDYEALIVDASDAGVDAIIERLVSELAAIGASVEIARQHVPAAQAHLDLDALVPRIAAGTISVLITGETGVGKEVLAERIHRLSPRAERPLLRLHCAALSESLLESELFGHERGAFTGAVAAKPGLLETAEGGTVFLDEIGELPMTIQVKLLRVLEERKVWRVGALRPQSIDVRFVSATHRDLEAEIARGRFRQDLYFRLNGIALGIAPLRERVAEIAPLARELARLVAGDVAPIVTPAAIARLEAYDWPGNIRELRNVIERAVLLSTDGTIGVEHLPQRARQPLPPPPPLPAPPRDDARGRIVDALARAGGNQTEAAKLLGVSRRTLINRLITHRIPRPRRR